MILATLNFKEFKLKIKQLSCINYYIKKIIDSIENCTCNWKFTLFSTRKPIRTTLQVIMWLY